MLSKHHKASIFHMHKLQKYNWMLMFHWPNLKTSTAMHVVFALSSKYSKPGKKCQVVSWRLSK